MHIYRQIALLLCLALKVFVTIFVRCPAKEAFRAAYKAKFSAIFLLYPETKGVTVRQLCAGR